MYIVAIAYVEYSCKGATSFNLISNILVLSFLWFSNQSWICWKCGHRITDVTHMKYSLMISTFLNFILHNQRHAHFFICFWLAPFSVFIAYIIVFRATWPLDDDCVKWAMNFRGSRSKCYVCFSVVQKSILITEYVIFRYISPSLWRSGVALHVSLCVHCKLMLTFS